MADLINRDLLIYCFKCKAYNFANKEFSVFETNGYNQYFYYICPLCFAEVQTIEFDFEMLDDFMNAERYRRIENE